MATDAPSHLPPVLRPDDPPVHALEDLAARFGRETRGEPAGATLTGLTLATADLRPGDVFVAVRGVNRHGAEFAAAAAEKGAVAVVTDAEGADVAEATGLPVIIVEDPRGMLGDLSAWVYGTGRDDHLPILFGTTGTNGKTSVSHLLEGILGQLGLVTGLSSTAERHIAGQVIVSRLTTPEAYEMHALLALMRERGVEAVAVEVSAQALSRRRVDGIVFDVAAFTNLTHDHLDDYADMREYFEAKLPLFLPDRARRAVISLDSAAGDRGRRPLRGALRHGGHARDRDRPGCGRRRRLGRRDPRRATDRHRVPAHVIGRTLADHDRAGHRTAHGRQRRARDRDDPRGRLRVGSHRRRPRARRRHPRVPPRPHRAGLGRARPGRLRRFRPLPRRVREDARRRAPRDARQGASCSSAPTATATRPSATTWVARPWRAATSSWSPTTTRASRTSTRSAPPSSRARAEPDPMPRSTSTRRPRSRSSRRSSSSATATRSCGRAPDTRTTATSAGSARPYSARELARRALRDAGWPVPEPHWPVPYAD